MKRTRITRPIGRIGTRREGEDEIKERGLPAREFPKLTVVPRLALVEPRRRRNRPS